MKLSRRVFLGAAAGGGLLALAGGVALAPSSVGQGRQCLSDDEFITLQAIVAALYPKSVLGIGGEDVQVADKVDAYVATFFSRERALLRLGLRLIEKKARLDGGGPFSALPIETRVEVWRLWEKQPLWGQAIFAIRTLTAMWFFQDPRVAKTIHWGIGCQVGAVDGYFADPDALTSSPVDGGAP